MALSPIEPRNAFLFHGLNGIETSVSIAEIVSGFSGVKRRGIKMPKQETVEEIFRRLNEHGIRYVLIGGLAYAEYAPPRATEDVDVIVLAEDTGKVRDLFPGCYQRGTAIAGIYQFEETRLDVQPAKRRAQIAAVKNAIEASFHDVPVKLAALRDLIFLKLWAAAERGELSKKMQDQTDIATLIEHNPARVSASDIAWMAKELLSMGYTSEESAKFCQMIEWLNQILDQLEMPEKKFSLP